MLAKQSGHTGKRETFNSAKPQIRQSDGKKMEKRLSAPRRAQWPRILDEASGETVEDLATAVAIPLARIRSSLLLKTASSDTPRA